MYKKHVVTSLGYGIAYEKALLFDLAKQWVDRYNIKSALEYPSNSFMDNNNEIFENILSTNNCSRLKRHEKTDKKYDIVWNFCEFEFNENSEQFIEDMINKSNGYVLLITQNYKNLGVPIHVLWHLLFRREWDHGIINKFSTKYAKKFINNEILEEGAFDCPWFYFDVYETFSDIKNLLGKGEKLDKEFTIKNSIFENLPLTIKEFICHHNYLIFKK